MRILLLFRIVSFRMEIPATNVATAKRKDGELLAAIHVAGSGVNYDFKVPLNLCFRN
jgi:hypothetical protein